MSTIIVLGIVFAILALLFVGMNQTAADEKVKAKQAKEERAGAPPIWLAASSEPKASDAASQGRGSVH